MVTETHARSLLADKVNCISRLKLRGPPRRRPTPIGPIACCLAVFFRATRNGSETLMIYFIFKDEAGKYRWKLYVKNREVAVSSEGYKLKKTCCDALDLVKKSSSAPVIDKTQ
ncbi:MAG: DUF1508 domain-containing protein [Terrimicrobiaceae bacterium]